MVPGMRKCRITRHSGCFLTVVVTYSILFLFVLNEMSSRLYLLSAPASLGARPVAEATIIVVQVLSLFSGTTPGRYPGFLDDSVF